MDSQIAEHTNPETPAVRSGQFTHRRLQSVDALRGFDMFWIIAGEHFFHKLAKATNAPLWNTLSYQFDHAEWHGFRTYDLIFPLFLFLAGVSTPFSIGSELDKGKSKRTLMLRVMRRALILVFLGWYCNNGLQIQPIAQMRFPSVLGRIGLAWMFANIIFLYTKEKTQIAWLAGLLIGYWLLLRFSAAPGYPPGDLSMQGNIVSYIDRLSLPGKLYLDIHDPEGLIATLPAVGTALLGIFSGNLLKSDKHTPAGKAKWLAISGVTLIAAALVWSIAFPINKNLWTSSFVLLTGGLSALLLALFYFVIDVLQYDKWAFFFSVIGLNSILIYISSRFIKWDHANNAFFKWMGDLAGEEYGPVAMAFGFLAVKWMLLYFLYRKKIFLRI